MKQKLLIDNQASQLLLIFGGWASDTHLFNFYTNTSQDVCLIYDYRNLELPLEFLKGYESIQILAWSMGVWAVHKLQDSLSALPITQCIAVNGTFYPMHDSYGIPVDVFKGTLEELNDLNYRRFQRRMFGGKNQFQALETQLSQRPIEDIKEELKTIYKQCSVLNLSNNTLFTKAYISRQDLIFPVSNQERFWASENVDIEWQVGAHYDVNLFKYLIEN